MLHGNVQTFFVLFLQEKNCTN